MGNIKVKYQLLIQYNPFYIGTSGEVHDSYDEMLEEIKAIIDEEYTGLFYLVWNSEAREKPRIYKVTTKMMEEGKNGTSGTDSDSRGDKEAGGDAVS